MPDGVRTAYTYTSNNSILTKKTYKFSGTFGYASLFNVLYRKLRNDKYIDDIYFQFQKNDYLDRK